MHIKLGRARRLNDEGTRPQGSPTRGSDEFGVQTLFLQHKYAVSPHWFVFRSKHNMWKEWIWNFCLVFLWHRCLAPFTHEPEAVPDQQVLQKMTHELSCSSSWSVQILGCFYTCNYIEQRWLVLRLPHLQEAQRRFNRGFIFKQNLAPSAGAFWVTAIRECHWSGSACQRVPSLLRDNYSSLDSIMTWLCRIIEIVCALSVTSACVRAWPT